LGVNTVDPVNGYEDALKAGVPFISVTFNAGLPEVIHQYYPNVLIGNRGNWNRGQQPSVEFFDDRNGGAYNIPGAYIMGLNENDHGLGVSAEDIRKRFEWDQRMLQHVKDVGGRKGHKLFYCGAGFSAGEPNIQDKSVVEALALYGELLADECFCFNYHTYTTDDHGTGCTAEFQRDMIWNEDYGIGASGRFVNGKWETFTEKFYRLEWTATRWHVFYRRCGWPRYDREGNLTRIVSDETQVDIGSQGGIPWFNMSDEWTQGWARRWVYVQGSPFDIGNGVMEPSHMVWGALFQVGAGTWQTYNMQRYCKALGACEWGRR